MEYAVHGHAHVSDRTVIDADEYRKHICSVALISDVCVDVDVDVVYRAVILAYEYTSRLLGLEYVTETYHSVLSADVERNVLDLGSCSERRYQYEFFLRNVSVDSDDINRVAITFYLCGKFLRNHVSLACGNLKVAF